MILTNFYFECAVLAEVIWNELSFLSTLFFTLSQIPKTIRLEINTHSRHWKTNKKVKTLNRIICLCFFMVIGSFALSATFPAFKQQTDEHDRKQYGTLTSQFVWKKTDSDITYDFISVEYLQNALKLCLSLITPIGNYSKTGEHDCIYKLFRNIPLKEYIVLPLTSLGRYFDDVLQRHVCRSEQMRHEWVRYATFKDFPISSPAMPSRLAKNGFYFSGQNDEVICFSCNLRYGNWTEFDVPMDIHKTLSPDCHLLTGVDQSNVCIHEPIESPVASTAHNSSTNTQNTAKSETETGGLNEASGGINETVTGSDDELQIEQHFAVSNDPLETGRHKHPDYIELRTREETFKDGWPCPEVQDPKMMAQSGFYYAGFADCVRCFSCGGGLRNWEYGDGPWEEHARWFPRCMYLRQHKTIEFIRDHQEVHEDVAEAEPTPSVGSTDTQEELISGEEALERLRSTPSPTHGLDGNNESKPSKPQSTASAENNTGTARENNDAKNNLSISYERDSNKTDGPDTQVYETLVEMGFPGKTITMTLDALSKQKKSVTLEDVLVKLTEKEGKDSYTESKPSPKQRLSPKSKSVPDGKVIKEENEKMKELLNCKICMDSNACVVFLPCGHIASCDACAPALRKCPICRKLIKGRVKMFMS